MGIRRRSACLVLATLTLAGAAGGAEPAAAANIVTANQVVATTGQSQTGRIFRDGVASSCGSLKLAPTSTDGGSQFHYINHTFRSFLADPICITIDLQTACTGTNTIFSAAYLDTFDPANPLTNQVADMGDSPPAVTSYSFSVPAGMGFAVVVHEITSGAGCSAYTLKADSAGPWAQSRPAIVGNAAAVGNSITGNDGTWVGTPVIARRWRRCDTAGANCLDIPGATASTYTVTNDDLGHSLRFRNEATGADGTSRSDSTVTEPFIAFETHPSESLGAGDRIQKGVFVRNGVESRCATPTTAPAILQPTTGFLYDVFPVSSMINEPVCLVARSLPSSCSTGVSPAIYNPVFDPATGLAANYAGNSGNAFAFVGTVSAALPAGEAREVAVSQGGTGGSCDAYSVTLGADAPFASARPVAGGSVTEGVTLTGSDGTWSGTPAFTREWRRCDANGSACTPIAGATEPSYTPVAEDVGRRLRLRVTATQGRSTSSDSAPTEPVAAAPPAAVGPPPAEGGPPVGLAPDRTAPKLTLRLGSRDLAKAVKTGRLQVVVTCDEACSGAVEARITKRLAKRLKLGRKVVVVARGKGAVKAGKKATLRVKLTTRARRALRKRKSLVITVAATFTDAAGNKAKRSSKGTLKRPAKHARRR